MLSAIKYDQDHILNQSAKFLEYQAQRVSVPLPKDRPYYDQTVQDVKQSKGECLGMSVLQMLNIFISRETKSFPSRDQKNIDWIVQDHIWAQTVRTDLSLWEPKNDNQYSPKQKTAILEYLQQVLFLQKAIFYLKGKNYSQANDIFSIIFNSKQTNYPTIIGGTIGFFNQQQLSLILSKFLANDRDRFILLMTKQHVGLLLLNKFNEKNIDFFDPNHSKGEQTFDSANKAINYFSEKFPKLKKNALNPTIVIAFKDSAIFSQRDCPSIDEVEKICNGEIPDISDSPLVMDGITIWDLLRTSFNYFGSSLESYLQYFCNLYLKKCDHQIFDFLVKNTLESTVLEIKLDSFLSKDSKNKLVDFNQQDHHGKTRLMHSVIFIENSWVKYFIDLSVKLDIRDTFGITAIIYSVYHNDVTIFKMLLDAGANPWIADDNHKNALDHAIEQKNKKAISLIVNSCWQNVRALTWAVSVNNLRLVQQLLEYGTEVNGLDKDGSTALMAAAALGRDEIVKTLLTAKADPLLKDKSLKNALTYAEDYGHIPVMDMLLKAGGVSDVAVTNNLPPLPKIPSSGHRFKYSNRVKSTFSSSQNNKNDSFVF